MSTGYQIDDEPFATGGQGEVYFGVHPDGRPIALKVAAPGGAPGRALMREMELMRHMNDAGVPGVVPVLDSFRYDGRPAMVMPRYSDHLGNWLKNAILEPNRQTLASLLTHHAKLARTIAGVHKVYYEGGTVVHRDIKPENIFVDDDGELWLGDFGGAMAVERLRAVELAMFGTPMWAPLDQLLPGRAIPDPTWDTYAICVLLYASVTGARPAYQADPRELLTPAGQALWQAATAAVEAKGPNRSTAHQRFAVMRKGTTAADLVDLTGRAALVAGDRDAIEAGLSRLATLADLDEEARAKLQRGLWNLLVRGLSPLSHPSPPNRFRDGDELAEAIDDLIGLVESGRGASLKSLVSGGAAQTPVPPPRRTVRKSSPWLSLAVAGTLVLGLSIALWLGRDPLRKAFLSSKPLPDYVTAEASTFKTTDGTMAVPMFRIDTTEASVGSYRACTLAGSCTKLPTLPSNDDLVVTGLSAEDAEALCKHRNGRLPTEAQWTIAHGPKRFPWGDEAADCDRAVGLGCADTMGPVGRARLGPSPIGAVDMAGHAWEWVRTTDGTRILMGGSLHSNAKELGKAGRKIVEPGTRPELAGVRCVYTP